MLNPGSESSLNYPPVIKLHMSLSKTCTKASFCYLEVKGVDKELNMMIEIVSHYKPKLEDAKMRGEKENSQPSHLNIN